MIGFITTAIGSLFAYIVGRRKAKAEALAKEIYNVDQAVDIWKELALDLRKQLNEVSKQCTDLSHEIGELRRENAELKKQITGLTAQIKKH